MTRGHIHRIASMPSVSLHLDSLAGVLRGIKSDEGLHDRDLGAVLGKSADRAEAARNGDADISAYSLVRGITQFGKRFDPVLINAGVTMRAAVPGPVGAGAPKILTAALLKIIAATEDGNGIDDAELREAGTEIRLLVGLAEKLATALARAQQL
jgi:hypothetical protein